MPGFQHVTPPPNAQADPSFKKDAIITYGPGRGNYADGFGGWFNAEPTGQGNPDFKPAEPQDPVTAAKERKLYEDYTAPADGQGMNGPQGQAGLQAIKEYLGIAGQDDSQGTAANVKLAQFIARACGHQ